MAPIQQAVTAFLRESGIGEKIRPSAVYRAWNAALGEALARHARPVRFRRGELCVEVDSTAHYHELKNFTGERLRATANGRLGKEEITRVVFRLKS